MNDLELLQKIKGMTADSRMIRKGWLFAALPGTRDDGRNFISTAIANGASVILAPSGTILPDGCETTLITDDDVRRRFALLSAQWFKGQPETIVGVTGTNGKTSVVTFVSQLWEALDHTSASLGTLGVSSRVMMKPGGMTTPDPYVLHGEMADLSAAGITHLALEASSHGLLQRRLDGVKMKAAAFTNLTQDHLDYHENMELYFTAKARLFRELLDETAVRVFYADDPYAQQLITETKADGCSMICYGEACDDIKLVKQTPTGFGQDLEILAWGEAMTIHLPLVGLFQGLNVLCAAALVLACDKNLKMADLVPYIEKMSGVPGRLQAVTGHPKGAAVYVDYAHTPSGLETVLKALRPHTKGKLVCVFGCGGDRDKGKRPLMGDAVARLADVGIVTDDNPRSEDPAQIRAAALATIPEAMEIGDRRDAIRHAIAALSGDDVLVIAGKGHEQGQTIKAIVHPFDDVEEARTAIEELK